MNRKPDVNTKEALLAAAIRVFADKGFDAATVRDICGMAQANVAAVNYHYGGKDALYAAVLDEVFPKDDRTQAWSDPSLPPAERLHDFLRGLAGEIFERGNELVAQRWAIFLREMAKPSQHLDILIRRQIQPRVDELRTIVADILGPGVSENLMIFCSTNVWALMLDHMLTQPILDRLTPSRPALQDIDRLVEHVMVFSLGGLHAVRDRLGD